MSELYYVNIFSNIANLFFIATALFSTIFIFACFILYVSGKFNARTVCLVLKYISYILGIFVFTFTFIYKLFIDPNVLSEVSILHTIIFIMVIIYIWYIICNSIIAIFQVIQGRRTFYAYPISLSLSGIISFVILALILQVIQ